MKAQYVHELEAYQTAFRLQQTVFEHTKSWPREEAYSLTDQIRRASRSIGANLSESWLRPVGTTDHQGYDPEGLRPVGVNGTTDHQGYDPEGLRPVGVNGTTGHQGYAPEDHAVQQVTMTLPGRI
jgi:hypothetical protein